MALSFDSGDSVTGKGREALMNGMLLCAQGNGVMDGLAVTEKGAGADMSVDVAAGGWIANATPNYASSTTNVSIDNGDAYLRYDLIYAKSDGTITVAKGTAAASDQEVPSVPANSIPLAVVSVAASESTSIADADITDARCILAEKQERLLQYNDTQATTSTTDSNMQSITITNAEASYPYLAVMACGEFASSASTSTSTSEIIFYDGSTQLGNSVKCGNSNNQYVDAVYGGWTIKEVLVAGTDYTRGTGFTLTTRTANLVGSITLGSSHLEVKGLID